MLRRLLHRSSVTIPLSICLALGMALPDGSVAFSSASPKVATLGVGASAGVPATLSQAPVTNSATMALSPATGSFAVGSTFVVSLTIDGGGQSFDTANAVVSVTGPVTVTSLTVLSPGSG